jgi:hypothetical protein
MCNTEINRKRGGIFRHGGISGRGGDAASKGNDINWTFNLN